MRQLAKCECTRWLNSLRPNTYNISSHDFRFTSARDKFEEKIKSGISQKEAKLKISQELNHKREAITDYYLKRTEQI